MAEIRFLSPIEGDILITGVDGYAESGRLLAQVRVAADAAPGAGAPEVNGVQAQWDGEAFLADVPLTCGPNTLTAALPTGEEAVIRVWWLKGAEKKYRFTVDDCIRCFEDLTAHQDEYQSLFENPYLAVYKEAHDKYGSRVHINVFYESEDGSFNLSMMTDKFREEFRANADWMTFTFHAQGEFPDEPYKTASYEKVREDCARCVAEIERFAGPEVLHETTTLHWGAANADGVRALRDAGYKALCGYLCFDGRGETLVSYHLTKEQTAHAEKREGWVDFDLGMLFAKLDFVLNAAEFPAEAVAPYLDKLCKIPHEGQFIQMVIHEQYFYPDYHHYEPDYAARILNMAKWMHEHGYESVSLTDLVKGAVEA